MSVRILLILSLVIALLGGCGPIMRDLQYGNDRSGLFPARMDLTIGRAKVDAKKLMKAQTYEGQIQVGDITVHYPHGMSSQAKLIGTAFEEARAEIKDRTGITWAFSLDLYLVPVTDTSQGFRLQFSLRGRKLSLPILVQPGREPFILPDWSGGIAHEITEASMLASLSRRDLVLGDYCWGGFALVNETRWFRDGVSDFAWDITNERLFGDRYQPPAWIYQELAKTREGLLDWSNCDDGSGYASAHALIIQLNDRFGPDVIARILLAASHERYINGGMLNRAVRKVTGQDLRQFLRDYRITWLGVDLVDTDPVPGYPSLVKEGNQVRVSRVYPRTPAYFWKLRPGDVILAVDGAAGASIPIRRDKPVVSAAWLTHYVAAHQPGDRIQVEIERAGERRTYRMKLAAR